MPAIHPSPALVVTSDTSLGDCVRQMRDRNAGSVLVVAYTSPHPLVGIFTERDLLRRVDDIQHGGHWDKAVASVMTRPVITVSLYELEQAAEIMLEQGIRHLPVVYDDDRGRSCVAGVISMRDLFRNAQASVPKPSRRRVRIALASNDPGARASLQAILSQSGRAEVTELSMEEVARVPLGKTDLVAVDLDRAGPDAWARAITRLSREKDSPPAVVLFDPALHDATNVAMVKKLSKNPKFAPFVKPVDVLGLLNQIKLFSSASPSAGPRG